MVESFVKIGWVARRRELADGAQTVVGSLFRAAWRFVDEGAVTDIVGGAVARDRRSRSSFGRR